MTGSEEILGSVKERVIWEHYFAECEQLELNGYEDGGDQVLECENCEHVFLRW